MCTRKHRIKHQVQKLNRKQNNDRPKMKIIIDNMCLAPTQIPGGEIGQMKTWFFLEKKEREKKEKKRHIV